MAGRKCLVGPTGTLLSKAIFALVRPPVHAATDVILFVAIGLGGGVRRTVEACVITWRAM